MSLRLRLGCVMLFLLTTGAASLEFHLHRGMNYLQFLGLERDYTPEALKTAYRKAMMKYHPDQGGSREDAQFVNEANEILKDEAKAAAFFRWLGTGEQPGRFQEPPPERDPEEIRRENIKTAVAEVFAMSVEAVNANPHISKEEMAIRVRTLLIYHARHFRGNQLAARDLAEMLNDFALRERNPYSDNGRFSLALGVIRILEERARYPGLEEGRACGDVLDSVAQNIERQIRTHHDLRRRQFLDRVYEAITGQSILRAPPPPPPRSPSVSACEAALNYSITDGLTIPIKITVDIRF